MPEAKFIALSMGMRDLILAHLILQALEKTLNLQVPEGAHLKSTVFKDNNGCMSLAHMILQAKHTRIKYFLFRSKISPKSGIMLEKVASTH
jgi:hypothetical protein